MKITSGVLFDSTVRQSPSATINAVLPNGVTAALISDATACAHGSASGLSDSSTRSDLPVRIARAASLRRYPSRLAVSRTRRAVVSEIAWLRGCPDST
jgi:hypothetical protein